MVVAEPTDGSGGSAVLMDKSANPIYPFDSGVGITDGVEGDGGVEVEAAVGAGSVVGAPG